MLKTRQDQLVSSRLDATEANTIQRLVGRENWREQTVFDTREGAEWIFSAPADAAKSRKNTTKSARALEKDEWIRWCMCNRLWFVRHLDYSRHWGLIGGKLMGYMECANVKLDINQTEAQNTIE